MLSDKEFDGVVNQFPAIDFGFAYGSGVVRQDGYDYESANKGLDAADSAEIKMTDSTPVVVEKKQSELPMVDMIFAVDDPKAWHTENMRQNPDHYTPLMTMNPVDVTRMQDSYGAGMWYNAMIAMNIPRCPTRMMKYGVISRQKLITDLTEWTTLYAAGRLQKPVRIIKTETNEELNDAIEKNKRYALRVSLILMPDQFEEIQLYRTIASLSYIGDPRMIIGENPKKVVNLVKPVVPQYKSLYKQFVDEAVHEFGLKTENKNGTRMFYQSSHPVYRWRLILSLPDPLKKIVLEDGKARMMPTDLPSAHRVRLALAAIVARAASTQSLKGIFTVGLTKGCTYILSKMAKRVMG